MDYHSRRASETLSSDRSTNHCYRVQRQSCFWSSGIEKEGALGIDMCLTAIAVAIAAPTLINSKNFKGN